MNADEIKLSDDKTEVIAKCWHPSDNGKRIEITINVDTLKKLICDKLPEPNG